MTSPTDPRGRPDDGYFVTVRSTPRPVPDGTTAGPRTDRRGGLQRSVGTLTAVAVALVALAATVGLVVWTARTAGSTSTRAPGPAATGARAALPEPYEGPGEFRIWVTNPDGSAVRWNPCEPIRWVFNADGAPAGGLADVRTGIDQVAAITGLTFRFDGTTDEAPSRDRAPYQPRRYGDRWAPVLVAWAAPGGQVPLTDHDRAATVPVAVGDGDRRVFVTGQVLFNRDRELASGFGSREHHWGGTVLHELAHLVGLDHVDAPTELLYPRPGLGPAVWGPGDRAGLERLGADLGCLTTPTAQAVDVEFTPTQP